MIQEWHSKYYRSTLKWQKHICLQLHGYHTKSNQEISFNSGSRTELCLEFYKWVLDVFFHCHGSFRYVPWHHFPTLKKMPSYAVLDTENHSCTSFFIHLCIRMEADLRSPLLQLLRINIANSFHHHMLWLTRREKLFSDNPSPADSIPFNHVCGFLLQ